MSKILLDTNAYVAYKAGDHQVLEALGRADQVMLCLFVD